MSSVREQVPMLVRGAALHRHAVPNRGDRAVESRLYLNGVLGVDQRPRFHSYVVERHHPSYAYQGEVRVGADLPGDGVTYYDVPPEYGASEYRYAVVNGRTVLVARRTHRIVEIVE